MKSTLTSGFINVTDNHAGTGKNLDTTFAKFLGYPQPAATDCLIDKPYTSPFEFAVKKFFPAAPGVTRRESLKQLNLPLPDCILRFATCRSMENL